MMKKVVGILLMILIIAQATLAFAVTQNDLKDAEKNINTTKENIKNIETQKSTAMQEVEKLVSQIAAYQMELDELNTQISDLEAKINQAEKDITVKEEEYNSQRELSEQILVAMYEKGETEYLDVLLSSTSIVDFISSYYLISELTDYNIEILENIEKERIEIENQKTELQNDKNELDTTKTSKEAKYNELKTAQAQKNAYVQKLTDQEKEEQEKLEQFEADKIEIAKELAKIAQQNTNKTNISNTPSQSGYISPLAGKTKANITTGYMGYTNPDRGNHTGVDFAIVKGTPIRAVKDGTVVTSTALKYSNGKYRSYGEYIVIDHHDGTMTLYGHMLENSRKVSVGDTVVQGQTIGLVGTTGNSTGYHLHFEVRINGKPVNPTPYLP